MDLPEWRDQYRLSLNELREHCRAYDDDHGRYPEHEYEGWAVFRIVVEAMTGDRLPCDQPEGWRKAA